MESKEVTKGSPTGPCDPLRIFWFLNIDSIFVDVLVNEYSPMVWAHIFIIVLCISSLHRRLPIPNDDTSHML